MAFLPLPWAHEAPGSNPGAPTTSSLNYLTFLLRRFLTSFRLWHTEERLRSDQVHTVSLRTCAGVLIHLHSCRHGRMPKLAICAKSRLKKNPLDS